MDSKKDDFFNRPKLSSRLDEFRSLDPEFDAIRSRFDDEMKKVEEEMNKMRTEMLNKGTLTSGGNASTVSSSSR
jgi:hypothetical protein